MLLDRRLYDMGIHAMEQCRHNAAWCIDVQGKTLFFLLALPAIRPSWDHELAQG